MDIFTAVRTVYSKYATFSGRASRAEFWYFFLFTIIAGAALSAIDATLSSAFSIANIVPNLAVAVRRLHDTNRSGKLIVALILIEVVLFLLIVVSFAAGLSGAIGGELRRGNGRRDRRPGGRRALCRADDLLDLSDGEARRRGTESLRRPELTVAPSS